MSYFFDTYAIIEIMLNNPSYEKYRNFPVKISILNIAEIYSIILRNKSKDEADKWLENYNFELLEISTKTIAKAVYFRFMRKNNISLTDAAGYLLSLENNLKFLTGDRQFKDMPNVEFVK
ncbi:PIN domain-containing protein [Candidatus Woesearchaeota archaeon]|nr:PIN domain-containing protein [Candidatus Woesearchaeota archaeon]